MRDPSGKVFVVYVDPADITAPTPNAEFAGIASDAIPVDDSLAAPIELIKYKGWLAFEEEPKAKIDWNMHTKPADIAAISEISPIQQKNCTPISFDDLPFYVDTGATVHISPEKSDFLTLKPTAACSVKGVGGSSITAIGIGSIQLRVAQSAYIILQSVLYIPNAAVCLISVSTLAWDNQAITHFDKQSCWITNKSTSQLLCKERFSPPKTFTPLLYTPFMLNMLSQHITHLISRPCTISSATQIIRHSETWSRME